MYFLVSLFYFALLDFLVKNGSLRDSMIISVFARAVPSIS